MTNSVVCTHQEMGRSLSSSWGWLMGLVSLILPSGVMAQESPAWVEPCLQELRQQYSLAVPGGGLNQPVTRGELSQLLHQIKTSSTPLGENLPRFTEHQGTEFLHRRPPSPRLPLATLGDFDGGVWLSGG